VLLYIVRRMALAVSVVFATMVLAFFLFFAGPGDPALNLCGDAKCNTQRVEEIRKSFHLDEPVSKQFADYALGVVAGREITSGGFTKPCPAPCLGYSFKTDQPVTGLLVARIPVTLSILCGAFVIYLLIGIPTGVYAANRRGTAVDRAIVGTTQTIGSIPYFVPACALRIIGSRTMTLPSRIVSIACHQVMPCCIKPEASVYVVMTTLIPIHSAAM